MNSFKNFIDKLLVNIASREFQVWAASCYLLYSGILDIKNWILISLGYMGLRSFQKVKEKELSQPTKMKSKRGKGKK